MIRNVVAAAGIGLGQVVAKSLGPVESHPSGRHRFLAGLHHKQSRDAGNPLVARQLEQLLGVLRTTHGHNPITTDGQRIGRQSRVEEFHVFLVGDLEGFKQVTGGGRRVVGPHGIRRCHSRRGGHLDVAGNFEGR